MRVQQRKRHICIARYVVICRCGRLSYVNHFVSYAVRHAVINQVLRNGRRFEVGCLNCCFLAFNLPRLRCLWFWANVSQILEIFELLINYSLFFCLREDRDSFFPLILKTFVLTSLHSFVLYHLRSYLCLLSWSTN